ncbi:MAG: endonuclease/exonuclease/phosphatase family protein [Candidatus Microsaccharimonas sp.]
MRITTLNLEGFNNWQRREPFILKYLQEMDSDILLFQEVVYIPSISPHNQVQLLNKQLEYPTIHTAITRLQASSHYEVFREGLGVLSKYPITTTDTIILKRAEGDEHNRIIQLLDVTTDEGTIKIANIHFSLMNIADFATPHLQETLEILASRGEQRIIAGDFNMNDLDACAPLWQEQYHASNQVEYISFPSTNERIDYFLIPESCTFGDVTISGDGLSDHRALTADITVS